MTLAFPNRSRSYDAARKAIRFLGYDGTFEVPFFVEVQALKASQPAVDSETRYLAAFDAARISIQDVAREVYSHGRKRLYVLTAHDFR
ncbi:uncharacterized protein DUF1488 [Aminobacter aminovorans]|jgi:hypothetical protein|uniref:Protein of uncharacterized function (DUF1488) n=1 Tax=Aminobacter aminovorans TaxID=83263 RepID=A0A381IP55_AMIAI|nr:DUF1488 domain-containing protein [Aminobacter aminovorans]TCS24604.1 uncharacterized protein DUF1488 [Aminobacter aminovorans]SUY29470.1 Protein of uncharacterised function (DUF1488) [Aminobacter aminovorans]